MSLLRKNEERTSTFIINGFKFKQVIILKDNYIEFFIYFYKHGYEKIIETTFTDVDDFQSQLEIIQDELLDYIDNNSNELERLYVYLDSPIFKNELKYGNNW